MLSALLNLPGGIDPLSGKVAGKTVKKVVKKVVKTAAEVAAQAAEKREAAAQAAAAAAAAATPAVEEVIDETPSALVEFLSSLDPTVTALVIGFILLVAFYIYRTKFSETGQRGDTYLLLGNMGSGKSAIYFQLKQGLFRETHTSMRENDASFVPKALEGKASSWRYVDLPGHASQRTKLDKLRQVAKGVVFVVDAASPDTFGKAAQFLYTLLVDPTFTARRTPFFIAFNKTDKIDTPEPSTDGEEEETLTPVDQLADKLEKILDKTRGLQSTMSDLDADGETRVRTLGREGEEFQFAHSVCPISYGGISASKGDLQDLYEFLQAQ